MKLISPELREPGKHIRYVALWGPWLVFLGIIGAIATLFSVYTNLKAEYPLFYCDSSDRMRYKYSADGFDNISPYWDLNLVLSVTMGFTGLTFVQAKAIDLCFDTIVGRGSQVLVALAAYPLLRRAFTRSMEVREFSLALLLPFFVERLSASTLWAIATNMRVTRQMKPESEVRIAKARVRIDWRLVLVFLVGCYVLTLPTFLSAMTSYQTRGEPYIPLDNSSSYMSTVNLTGPNWFVQNGEQIGLTAQFPLYNTSDPQIYAACIGYRKAMYTQVHDLWQNNWGEYSYATSESEEKEAELAFNKSRDALPLRQNITDSQNPSMWSFTLWPHNATWSKTLYYYNVENYMSSTIVIRNTTYHPDSPVIMEYNLDGYGPDRQTKFTWDSDNKTATGDYLATIGNCLPSKDYMWGLSSLLLFIFCMLTVAVLLLLIILHYDAYCNSMADQYKLNISPYRDVLDLADELRKHYGETEVTSMSATALDEAMEKDPATAGLETKTLHKTRAARWRQGKTKLRLPTWESLRKGSEVEGSTKSDAEESLMAIGRDGRGGPVEMGKLPARAITRQVS